jgi:hypothetical protein
MKTLPKKLYVKVEQDGDISYFVADAAIDPLVEMNDRVKVGVYELVETYICTGEVKKKKIL